MARQGRLGCGLLGPHRRGTLLKLSGLPVEAVDQRGQTVVLRLMQQRTARLAVGPAGQERQQHRPDLVLGGIAGAGHVQAVPVHAPAAEGPAWLLLVGVAAVACRDAGGVGLQTFHRCHAQAQRPRSPIDADGLGDRSNPRHVTVGPGGLLVGAERAGQQLVGPVGPDEQRAHGRSDDGVRAVHADSLRRAGGSCRSPAGSAGVPWPRKGRPQGVPSGDGSTGPSAAREERTGLAGPGVALVWETPAGSLQCSSAGDW